MDDCEETRRVGLLHDGELSAGQRERTEAHLAGCAACRAALVEVRGVSALLRTAVPEAVPAGLLGRMHAAVDAFADRLIRRFAYCVAAAAAAVLLACSLWLWQGDQAQPPPEAASEVERIAIGGETQAAEPIDQLAFLMIQDLAENDTDVR